tara:strand:- start:25 stop:345 length:321 start_codon:yes stop_codon:yes gene_type:complete
MFRIILGLAILLPSFAFAGEWRTKPVRCGSLEEVNYILVQQGEEYLLNGAGTSFDNELIAFSVQVGLWANLETGTWSMLETDGNEACVLAYGDDLSFDLLDGKPGT